MVADKTTRGIVYRRKDIGQSDGRAPDAWMALDVLDTLADPVIVLDEKYQYRYVNQAAADLIGVAPADLTGKNHDTIHPPDKVARLRSAYRQVIESGRPMSFQEYCEPLQRWFDVTVWPYAGQSLVLLFRDATERMALADELAATGERLCSAFADAAVGVTVTSATGVYIAANPAFCRMTGYSLGELKRMDFLAITHPHDRQLNVQLKSDLEAGKIRTVVLEKRYVCKHGTVIWVRANVCGYGRGRPEWFLTITEDVTERRRTAEKLLNSEARFRALTENAMDVTSILDAGGRFVYQSSSIELVAGYQPAEMIGGLAWDYMHPDDLPRIVDLFTSMQGRFGGTVRAEFRFRNKQGEWRTFESIATNLLHNPAVCGVVVNSRDITERTEAQAALQAALAEAKSATELKSRFLANMSHEIRTPMNGVLGMTELLGRTPLSDEQRECVDVIARAAGGLLTIINDILDMSRIEAGKLQLDSTPVDVRKTVEGVADLFRAQTRQKRIELTASIGREVPRAILSDPVRLAQVLTNLLGNAVKFTVAGRVSVTVGIDRRAKGLRFSVSDTGIGIAPEHRASLFTTFAQGDSSTTRRFGGAGLGLAISKQIIELMGGEIGFTSTPGRGSTFWFTMPAEPCEAAVAAAGAQVAGDGPTAGSGRILVAEDNEVNRRIALRILQNAGYSVGEATDGREALDALRKSHYDAVLMDVHMPEMDGFEATRALRELEKNLRRTPVIAITANAMAGDRERCLAAGMDDYLAKPYKAKDMLDKVRTWLSCGVSA